VTRVLTTSSFNQNRNEIHNHYWLSKWNLEMNRNGKRAGKNNTTKHRNHTNFFVAKIRLQVA